MEIEVRESNGEKIALVPSDNPLTIKTTQDAVELLMNCNYNLDTAKIIIHEQHLTPAFFDLKTGVAGDILQKFSTYTGHLAIVVDITKFTSNSLQDFIRESNKMKRINFVATEEEGLRILSG